MLAAYVEHDRTKPEMVADGFDPMVVDTVVRLVDRAEYKRRQLAPGSASPPRRSARIAGCRSPTATGPRTFRSGRAGPDRHGRGHLGTGPPRPPPGRRSCWAPTAPSNGACSSSPGRWPPRPRRSAEIGVYLDSLSTEHAWHAELWADRLPVVSGIDAQALVVVPPAAGGVRRAGERWGQVGRLAGLFRVVLPRLVTSYAYHEAYASAAVRGPHPAGAAPGPARRGRGPGGRGSPGAGGFWAPGEDVGGGRANGHSPRDPGWSRRG